MFNKEAERLDTEEHERLQLPRRFWNARLKDLEGKIKDQVQKYLDKLEENYHSGYGVFIFGPPRSGKTHISAILLRALAAHGVWSHWGNVVAIVDRVVKNEYFGIEEPMPYRQMYQEIDALVIDSFGRESPAMFNIITNIMQLRYDDNRVTIINCPLTRDDFADRYGKDELIRVDKGFNRIILDF